MASWVRADRGVSDGAASAGMAGRYRPVVVPEWRPGASRARQEFDQQPARFLRLFLLYPVAGAVYHVHGAHVGAGGAPHPFQGSRALVAAPVARARDADRRLVDRATGEELLLGGVDAARPIVVEPALETGPAVFLDVDPKLVVR